MDDQTPCSPLTINKSLIDPAFDGYKLRATSSSTVYPVPHCDLYPAMAFDSGGNNRHHSYTLSLLRYSAPNLVSIGADAVAFVDMDWRLVVVRLSRGGDRLDMAATQVHAVPLPVPCQVIQGSVPSITTARSGDVVIVTDGLGAVHIVQLLHTTVTTYTSEHPYVVNDAVLSGSNLHIAGFYPVSQQPSDGKRRNTTYFVGIYMVFDLSSSTCSTAIRNDRIWVSSTFPVLTRIEVEHGVERIILATNSLITEYLPLLKAPSDGNVHSRAVTEFRTPDYAWTWTQTADSVSLKIDLTAPVLDKDLDVKLGLTTLNVVICSCQPFSVFDHTLYESIDFEKSTWTMHNPTTVLIQLQKLNSQGLARWPELFKHSTDVLVLEDIDAATLAQYQDQLSRYTTQEDEQENVIAEYNSKQQQQDLEEVDFLQTENLQVHVVNILFNKDTTPNLKYVHVTDDLQTYLNTQVCGGICVKTGFDGLVYKYTHGGKRLVHMATINGFAYVHASKVDRKYSMVVPPFGLILEKYGYLYAYCGSSLYVYDLRSAGEKQVVVGMCLVGERAVGVTLEGGGLVVVDLPDVSL